MAFVRDTSELMRRLGESGGLLEEGGGLPTGVGVVTPHRDTLLRRKEDVPVLFPNLLIGEVDSDQL